MKGRSVLILALVLAMITATTSAVKFSGGIMDSSGTSSASGKYQLQNAAFLESELTIGSGFVSRISSAGGDGENLFSEGMSGNGLSVTNTVNSDGSFSIDSSDSASGAGAASSYQARLEGSRGSINSNSNGQENNMAVTGGFSGQGDMQVSMSSFAAEEALTTGSASVMGTPCFSDTLAQGIRGQDMGVSVQGLYLTREQGIGEFGMIAQNAKGGAAKPTPTTEGPYKLTGYMWPRSNPGPMIPIRLSTDVTPTGLAAGTMGTVKTQISAAEGTWDGATGIGLFAGMTSGQGGTAWSQRDGQNVHLWTSDTSKLSSGTIALTATWFTRAKVLVGADGNRYSQVVESDCWYNNAIWDQNGNLIPWRIDGDGAGTESSVDIRTIALHELGHTIGLADLYDETINSDKTMYGYNDGTADWTLATGDITGLQKLYGV